MLLLLTLIYTLDTSKKYYIQTRDDRRLVLKNGSIRLMNQVIINEKKDSISDIVTLTKQNGTNTYQIQFFNGRNLCKKKADPGVVSCEGNDTLTKWIFKGNENIQIMIEGKCLTSKANNLNNGDFVQVNTCTGITDQIFRLVEVPTSEIDTPVVEDPKSIVEEPTAVSQEPNPIVEEPTAVFGELTLNEETKPANDEPRSIPDNIVNVLEKPTNRKIETRGSKRLKIVEQNEIDKYEICPIRKQLEELERQRELF